MSRKLQTVHVRVNDAATGQPTPCRVRFTDAEGNYYAPFGRLTQFPLEPVTYYGGNVLLDGGAYAYIDGACEIQLPAGPMFVAIHKGPQYRPIITEVSLTPGKLALRFEVERWSDLRTDGWFAGDVRCYDLTPHAALLEAGAEDLTVVNLLARECWVPVGDGQSCLALPNILAFSGQRPALESNGHVVVVNTMNRHDKLGTLLLLNCHRPVYPLRFGDPQDGLEDWSLADWCDQCHRKGGLVVDATTWNRRFPYNHEVLADCLLGKVDALAAGPSSTAFRTDHADRMWIDLLNCGSRLPLVGGSGKQTTQSLLGDCRTYARLGSGQGFNYGSWIEAIRAGRCFATAGPLLSFQVNGEDSGSVLNLAAGTPTVQVRAEAKSLVGLERLELIRNGKTVSCIEGAGPRRPLLLESDLAIDGSCWLLAQCVEPDSGRCSRQAGAIASPVYVQVGGEPMRPEAAALQRLDHSLDQMLVWVAEEARCDDKQRERLANIFRSARQELLKRSTV